MSFLTPNPASSLDLNVAEAKLQASINQKHPLTTVDSTPTAGSNLVTSGGVKTYVDTQVAAKQNIITADDLTISMTSGLQTALDGKQPTIADAGLTIAKTSGLQTALNDKISSQWTTSGSSISYTTGNVGIGVSDPAQILEVRNDGLNAALQQWSSVLGATAGERTLKLRSPPADTDNSPFEFQTANAMSFLVDSVNALCIDHSGKVGLGTNDPDYPLDITSGVANNPTSAFGYLVEGDADTQGSAGQYTAVFGTGEARQISIRAARNILTEGAFVSTCDRRIKTNIQDVDDNECLRILRNIKPKKYKYINQLEKGYSTVYGYIAQDVKEHLPYSVVESVGFIPNVYQMASFVNDEIEINTSLLDASSSCLKLMNEYADHCFAEYEIIHDYAIKVVNLSNHQLNIETTVAELMDRFFNQDKEGNNRDNTKLFVYGNKVNDFHSLAKEDINVIAVGAIQQLDSQIDSLTKRIQALESLT